VAAAGVLDVQANSLSNATLSCGGGVVSSTDCHIQMELPIYAASFDTSRFVCRVCV